MSHGAIQKIKASFFGTQCRLNVQQLPSTSTAW